MDIILTKSFTTRRGSSTGFWIASRNTSVNTSVFLLHHLNWLEVECYAATMNYLTVIHYFQAVQIEIQENYKGKTISTIRYCMSILIYVYLRLSFFYLRASKWRIHRHISLVLKNPLFRFEYIPYWLRPLK